MSEYVKRKGAIEFRYGYDEDIGEYWYEVYDHARSHINDGLVEEGGSKSTGMPPLVLAEKLKQFNAPLEHIQKVLWMRKI
jgi:hypothetical protein